MPRFRKKPVVIEAVQWDGELMSAQGHGLQILHLGDGSFVGSLMTVEGQIIVQPDDWIITGVEGERYPCKPSIFKATYEPAD